MLTQKQICPRIDKEVDAFHPRSFTNGCDPPGVLVDWIEPGALNDAVFEIDPDDAEFKEAGRIFGQRTIVVAVAPFEVDGHRCFDRAYDARNDLLDECDRNGFAVPVTLRLRDSPAAGRNGLCARVQDRFRGAGVPRIVQQQRRAFDVELGKSGGLFDLVHFTLLLLRQRATKPLRPQQLDHASRPL